jgi:hypothetical protein
MWAVVVIGLYFLFIKLVGVKSAGTLVRALYAIYFVLIFLYLILLSPYTRFLRVTNAGFYIALAVLVLLIVALFVTAAAGRASHRGDS